MIRTLRVLLCLAVLASCAGADGNERGGRHLPVSHLSEMVQRVSQAAFRHSDQLPVDRQRRRHSPGAGGYGGFRRQRWPDDATSRLPSRKVKVLHVPTVLGAVVPAYNIPGVTRRSEVHARRAGRISTWARSPSGTMRAITKVNPGVKFPDQNITVVHRSDGSGTTYIFTDYLSKVSSDWAGRTSARERR